jgi:RimJ/RimL family protein N-acetyltransferase
MVSRPNRVPVRIETDRLILRPLSVSDLEDVVALHREPAVVEFLGPVSRAEALERLRSVEQAWLDRGHDLLAILERSSGRFVGRVGLRHWPQFGETEVGWALPRHALGHGYATDAARACMDWGFASFPFPYVTAMIRPDNSRSLAVARRLGMEPIRDDVMFGVPVVAHAIRRDQWTEDRPNRDEEVEHLLERVAAWAGTQPHLLGVAVVGSQAARSTRPDSDLDLVFLSSDPERYIDDEVWAHELCGGEVRATARRGLLAEQRVMTAWGLELDVGIVPARWASVSPVEPGTAHVARGGLRIVFDPEGSLARLERAVAER